MDNNRKGIVKQIMEMPEGKQFLAATLFAIMFLASFVTFQFWDKSALIREHKREIKDCEQKGKDDLKERNEFILTFVMEENRKKEKTKDKIDSMNLELIKIKVWRREH